MGIFDSAVDFVSDTVSPIIEPFAPYASAAASYIGGSRANEMSQQAARDQRQFQRKMSNTAARRSMRDLKKAGLNPIMALGGSASTPAGAMPQVRDPLTPAVNSGLQALTATTQLEQMREQTKLLTEQAELVQVDQWIKEFEGMIAQWDLAQRKVGLEMITSQLEKAKLDGELNASTYGVIMRYIERFVESVSPFTGSAPQYMPRGK